MKFSNIGSGIVNRLEKVGIVREKKDPDVKRMKDPEDKFDHFKGVNLGIIKIGKFRDQIQTSKTDTCKDPEGAKRIKKVLESSGKLKDVKVDPNAERTTEIAENEIFRGIALGQRWKIGRFHTDCSKKVEKTYSVDAKIPVAGGHATVKTKVSETWPSPTETLDKFVITFGK